MTAIDQHTLTLHHLMNSCHQAEASFRSAAAAMEDDTVKRLFEIYAQQRIRFAEELREYVPFDSDPAESWRGDADEPAMATNDWVRECVQTNARVLELYREALADRSLPTRERFLISAQLALMEPVHDRVSLLLRTPKNFSTQQVTRIQTVSA